MAETYTYDPVESTPKDRVRGLIGDVGGKDQEPRERVSDERIAALLVIFEDEDDVELRAAVEAARTRYRAVAGQKSGNERAPGLEPNRRFERLRQVWLDLKAKLDGTDTDGVPIMTAHDTFPCNVIPAKIGALDEPGS
jgi:hypothetical protein